jgi:predicted alpha/beta-fold hydrolase
MSAGIFSGAGIFCGVILVCSYVKKCKKPAIYVANQRNHLLLDRCPSLHRVFWPSPYCWNEHLQLILFVINPFRFVFQWNREWVTLDDGEQVALDWLFPDASQHLDGRLRPSNEATPILVLHHGSTCNSHDLPGQSYIKPALQRGWLVCALNRRGHGGALLTRPKLNFFGCCDDLHTVTQHILKKRPNSRLLTIGISAGSALVARHFGKSPSYNDFFAGVAVVPGYDITNCMSRVGAPYQVRTLGCCYCTVI